MRMPAAVVTMTFSLACATPSELTVVSRRPQESCCEGPRCLVGLVVPAPGSGDRVRVVIHSEEEWVAERGRSLPTHVGELSPDDRVPADFGGRRVWASSDGWFCVRRPESVHALLRLFQPGYRPVALILDGESDFVFVRLKTDSRTSTDVVRL